MFGIKNKESESITVLRSIARELHSINSNLKQSEEEKAARYSYKKVAKWEWVQKEMDRITKEAKENTDRLKRLL